MEGPVYHFGFLGLSAVSIGLVNRDSDRWMRTPPPIVARGLPSAAAGG
jgi:hypothetical protein